MKGPYCSCPCLFFDHLIWWGACYCSSFLLFFGARGSTVLRKEVAALAPFLCRETEGAQCPKIHRASVSTAPQALVRDVSRFKKFTRAQAPGWGFWTPPQRISWNILSKATRNSVDWHFIYQGKPSIFSKGHLWFKGESLKGSSGLGTQHQRSE